MGMLIIGLVMGAILSVVAVLGIWLALGKSTLMRRGIVVLIAASLFGLGICAVLGEAELEWLALVWVIVVTVTATFLFVRGLGFRLVHCEAAPQDNAAERQFSLWQLLLLTAVFAVIASVARMLAPFAVTSETLWFGIIIAFTLAALSIATTWATLRAKHPAAGLRRLAVFAVAVAGLVYFAVEVSDADPGLVWASIVLGFTFMTSVIMLQIRSRGFQLQSIAERSEGN